VRLLLHSASNVSYGCLIWNPGFSRIRCSLQYAAAEAGIQPAEAGTPGHLYPGYFLCRCRCEVIAAQCIECILRLWVWRVVEEWCIECTLRLSAGTGVRLLQHGAANVSYGGGAGAWWKNGASHTPYGGGAGMWWKSGASNVSYGGGADVRQENGASHAPYGGGAGAWWRNGALNAPYGYGCLPVQV
jgi:hypothetical protein